MHHYITVAQLIVRNIDPDLIRCLEKKAEDNGVSTEEEHLSILKEALAITKVESSESFKQHLQSMPNFEDDGLFEFDRNLPERTSPQKPLGHS